MKIEAKEYKWGKKNNFKKKYLGVAGAEMKKVSFFYFKEKLNPAHI